MKKLLLFVFCILVFIPNLAFAQETLEVKGEVLGVEEIVAEDGEHKIYEVENTKSGDVYIIDTSKGYTGEKSQINAQEGDHVLVQILQFEDQEDIYFLVDIYRAPSIIWIFLFFALLAIIVGRKRGLFALAGIGVTVAVLFGLLFPLLLHGWNALLVTILASVVILTTNMFLSHGIDQSTKAALLGTYGGLLLTIIFATTFVAIAHLTGLGSEDAALLVLESGVVIPKGILLSGIILGAVGVLDDVAINQTEIVSEILKANPKLSRYELFKRAMHIGRHHIASSVNTLVLAYAGAALPMFLLFMLADIGFMRFISEGVVAEEIIRTLAGTSALMLTVPLATWFATILQKR